MRRQAAIIAARTASALSRRLRVGGGTALPGLVAERIDPGLVGGLALRLGRGSTLITGTNGKTTTSRMIRAIVRAAGWKPVANREGSNMMRGIAAALADNARWNGRFRDEAHRMGVFEVDEATLGHVARAVEPTAIVFTNLFRDQLDRYGEVETVASLWRDIVSGLPPGVTTILNADDPSVASLRDVASGQVILYGIQDPSAATTGMEHAADARWCRRCGDELQYEAVYYGHIGHWACRSCGNARPQPQVVCTGFEQDAASMEMTVDTPQGALKLGLPVTGTYNAYNALAAVASGLALGLNVDVIERGISRFTVPFGRQERIAIGNKWAEIILAKNPAGLNQVLRVITSEDGARDLVLVLNDRIADGQDISWIWDVDFEVLRGRLNSLYISGDRAWDMALRIKYAGVSDAPRTNGDLNAALRDGLSRTPPGGTLYVVPTYTAMLELRNILGKWSGKGPFWEGDSR